MVDSTFHPPRVGIRSGLVLLLAAACLVMATPTRADPHDHGRRGGHGFIGRRHETRDNGPKLGVRRHHDARHDREHFHHAKARPRGEIMHKRALRERHDRRTGDAWHRYGGYHGERHEHDPWRGRNGWGDDGWHRHDRFFLGFHGPGVWVHGWDDDRFGWWLSVAGSWYFYPDGAPAGQVVVVQTPPTPSGAGTATPPPPQYWYYCRAAGKYYPYARHCPGGWQKVPARPAGQ